MNAIDQRIASLESYKPDLTVPHDLDGFWERTLRQFTDKPLNGWRNKLNSPLSGMDVYEVTYEGYDDTPIHGWYLLPKGVASRGVKGKLPCLIHFHGYSGGKGYPEQYAQWLLMGIAVFTVDIRGQVGETGNRLQSEFGMAKGWVSQGILDKDTCYYKAVAIDCLKAVEWAAGQEEIDPSHIYLEGASQGGGLVLLTAALSDIPALAIASVPNMCHMDFGMLNSTGSLTELASLANAFPSHLESILHTVSFFDIMNLAERIRIPVLISVGLKDTVCMPETVYAAYNRMTCEKQIHPYPFMGHEHTGYHNRKAIEFIEKYRTSRK